MAPTPQLDAVDRGLATQRIGIDVVKLHEPPLVAAMSAASDERATAEVTDPDGSLDRGRWISGTRSARTRTAWLGRIGKFLLRQIRQERRECAVQERRVVARRDRVT